MRSRFSQIPIFSTLMVSKIMIKNSNHFKFSSPERYGPIFVRNNVSGVLGVTMDFLARFRFKNHGILGFTWRPPHIWPIWGTLTSNCSISAVKRSFLMIFGANFRNFHELFHRTFKTVIDSDYDYRNRGWAVIGAIRRWYFKFRILWCGVIRVRPVLHRDYYQQVM